VVEQAVPQAVRVLAEARRLVRVPALVGTRCVLQQVLELGPAAEDALVVGVARRMGLSAEQVDEVARAAELHDIGKIAIPDSILLKPGRLTEEEFEVVKTHAVLGARVLAGGVSELFSVAETIARHHHERWDGGGYPYGLAGEKIPVAARIVRVADVYDVLVHERPYRESLSTEAASEEIARGAGSEFDPAAVEVFKNLTLQV